ncbi:MULTISPECIES: aminotransferase class V-fold PLP-dependent enzyme [unclassified Crossiella]|uniref:aminotransferase class V-fold PLP-dependent enzyme n=1 Tax=unclassified Crossiella TaxID=2620835 RepID=UPI001FFE4926|nr:MULTISPECIES: aminotransferase class V-fold PLP-dependent enzyme [unclassified Crossiella]MCK2240279.1 aminotransferase class V-fold PLP-dependent enzyme [Crossiella sp. S99.2]MCK2253269.1 aminotransferase class V-fold PLP-dependent enzyme [Crossiella sp. S99.1]
MSLAVIPAQNTPAVTAVATPTAQVVPAVVGAHTAVPLVTGERVTYANLDHGASAPCLAAVRDAVDELLPYYASVHRGAGFASQVCTKVYEQARDVVRKFVGAHSSDVVVFTRNSTDALNLLARSVPKGASVVTFDTDHHAALLPWRGPRVTRIATPETPQGAIRALEEALGQTPEGARLVVLTGASNVTGELWPVRELAAVARRFGARIALDAAQLAPHRPVDIQALDVDYVVLSAHKLYAPYGSGALIGRADWLHVAEPYLVGGGATKHVVDWGDHLGVGWAPAPERHEAGSPNVVGVHAFASACQTITQHGWDAVIAHETELFTRLRAGLNTLPGFRELSIFGAAQDRVGVVSFTLDGQDPGLVAAVLSAEHGIGVRDGAFCAHIATRRLLGQAGSDTDRAVRISLGLGTTAEHIDRVLDALRELVAHGPGWKYEIVDGRWAPVNDPRPLPPFVAG